MTRGDEARYFSIARVEAYTDGVFAIAATLLVLDLTTTAFGEIRSDADLWAALTGMGENVVAFLVSFVLLSLLWMIHLRQFRDFARADSVLLWLNSARLLFIVLIPFTTTLVAEYSEFAAGRVLLPINFFFAALFGHLSWRWAASRNGHLLRRDLVADVPTQNRAGLSAVICAAIAAILSPWLGSAAFLVFVFNRPLELLLRRMASSRTAAS